MGRIKVSEAAASTRPEGVSFSPLLLLFARQLETCKEKISFRRRDQVSISELSRKECDTSHVQRIRNKCLFEREINGRIRAFKKA